eukprot:5370736-Pyramimonas_sp.AAC.1
MEHRAARLPALVASSIASALAAIGEGVEISRVGCVALPAMIMQFLRALAISHGCPALAGHLHARVAPVPRERSLRARNARVALFPWGAAMCDVQGHGP